MTEPMKNAVICVGAIFLFTALLSTTIIRSRPVCTEAIDSAYDHGFQKAMGQ